MNTEQVSIAKIIEIAKTSAALEWQSDRKGTFAYPERFGGKVPLKVRMKQTVTADFVMVFPNAGDLVCIQGNEYYVWVNSYGAVSAILPNGKRLGLKPDEFEVVEYHNSLNKQQ